MNKKNKTVEKLLEKERKRLSAAKKSFKKLQEEIAPFIKQRKFKQHSTAGEWRETSSLYKN